MIQNNYIDEKIIGITGGIATGKSTVVDILLSKGYIVIDADKISREIVEIGKPAYNKIVSVFGDGVLNNDKSLNRLKLGEIVFKDEEYRFKLNKIIHPEIIKEIKYRINKHIKDDNIIFVDIPLLIEIKDELEDEGLNFYQVWLVYVSGDIQLERLMKRDNLSEKSSIDRIKSQMSIEEKKKYCDVIIDNTKEKKELIKRVNELITTLE